MNWFAAQTLFHTARDKSRGKPLKKNTRLYEDSNGDFYIVLHSTRIITIHRDGTFTLNTRSSHGWGNKKYRTPTTKQRINQYSPVHIYQRDWVWYVGNYDDDDPQFFDGMRVDEHGVVMKE